MAYSLVKKFTDNVFDWQINWLSAFDRKIARYFMGECHRRSRKTTLGINGLIREAVTHKNANYFYMGPYQKEVRLMVWLDPNMLFSYLPDKREIPWQENNTEMYIHFTDHRINTYIHFLGADNPQSLRGTDWSGGVLDEWDQMKEEIWTEILYPIYTTNPNKWIWFFYTPKGQHAPEMFDKKGRITSNMDLPVNGPTKDHEPGWFLMRLDAEHSKILMQQALEEAKREMPAHLYDQEMRCARVTAEERALISSLLINSLSQVTIPELERRQIISCDPSEGGDEIVLKHFNNTVEDDMEILHHADIMENIIVICHHLRAMSIKHNCKNFIIDSVGCGAGVAGAMRLEKDNVVIEFKGNEKADEPERFYDINMEATYYVSRQMRLGNVAIIQDRETRRQLPVASRFQPDSKGRLKLDKSEDIKKDLKQSPDRAKAYIMGIYGLQFVLPESVSRKEMDNIETERPRSAMAMG